MPLSFWAAVGLLFFLGGCSSCQRARSEGDPGLSLGASSGKARPAPPAPSDRAVPAPTDAEPAEDSEGRRPPRASPLLVDLPEVAPLDVDVLSEGATEGLGVVTSVEPQATGVGVDVLRAGGNAVDAAVATAFALAVTHPSAGNIGGGGFALVRHGQSLEAIDFREDSPRGLTREVFDQMIASGGRGPLSVGVPGTVAGLHLLHARHGRLPWSSVLSGAVQLAKSGARLGRRQHQTLGWARAGLLDDETARATFFRGKLPVGEGTLVRQEKLALALERIAQEGPDGFYRGAVAEDIVRTLQRRLQGSASLSVPAADLEKALPTLEDLAAYRAELRLPLSLDYHGARVVTMPPPSAGGATLLLNLSMLEASRATEVPPGSWERLHLLIEASRRAQVERRLLLSAPERMTESHEELLARFQSAQTWLGEHPIDPEKATRSDTLHPLYEESLRELEHTTHLSVVDRDGTAVSLTVTLSGSFGSQVLSEETGIVLNNSVASFGSVGRNMPAPAVRTMSSMAPTLVFCGPRDLLVLGSPGGDTIPSTITQLVLSLVDDRASLKAAVEAPRLHQGFVPDEVSIERLRPLPASVISELTRRGHRVRRSRSTIGDANIAAWVEGRAIAVYDPREGGLAAGPKKPPHTPDDANLSRGRSPHRIASEPQ